MLPHKKFNLFQALFDPFGWLIALPISIGVAYLVGYPVLWQISISSLFLLAVLFVNIINDLRKG